MEKLIRGSASRPHLLTHFHPSHHPPLQLPLSVIHSPSTANELILSHTLCLQLYLFLRTVQHGFFFFLPPPESERRLLAPTMSPIRCPSIHPSVISPSSLLSSCFSRLPVLEAGCKTGCLIQMETSPAVAAVLLLRQSHISLFSLGACVWSWCVCVCVL